MRLGSCSSCATNSRNVKNTVFEVKVNEEIGQKYSCTQLFLPPQKTAVWIAVEEHFSEWMRIGSCEFNHLDQGDDREQRSRLVRSRRLYRGERSHCGYSNGSTHLLTDC